MAPVEKFCSISVAWQDVGLSDFVYIMLPFDIALNLSIWWTNLALFQAPSPFFLPSVAAHRNRDQGVSDAILRRVTEQVCRYARGRDRIGLVARSNVWASEIRGGERGGWRRYGSLKWDRPNLRSHDFVTSTWWHRVLS